MNILELSATMDLDTSKYDEKLAQLSQEASGGGGSGSGMSKFGAALSSFAGNLASDLAMKALSGIEEGISSVANGFVNLTKSSLDAYGSFEQLVGGVETLFGDSAPIVEEYANRAYETAGLSANAYMETVTSFSASLLQGLEGDTEAAASVANRAIIDMSDNANKMGTNIGMIQNAYQGFAKQNYTMLDNLKLGYGGTKEEMERLIQDASGMTEAMDKLGVSVDAGSMSFDNIINAISVVQENMGITGTTASEAADTIEGSTNSMKAAWENLIAGLGNSDADIGDLTEKLLSSVETAALNIIPRLGEILKGMGTTIVGAVPLLIDSFMRLWTEVAPSMFDGAVTLVTTLLDGFITYLPTLVETGNELTISLIEGIFNTLPDIIDMAFECMDVLIESYEKYFPQMTKLGIDILMKLIDAILAHLDDIIRLTLTMNTTMFDGLIQALPVILAYAPQLIAELVMAIIECLPEIIKCAILLITTLATSIFETFVKLTDDGYWFDMIMKMVNVFTEYDWKSLGTNIINGIINGVTENVQRAYDAVKNAASNIMDAFKDKLGIHSPSKMFNYYGKMIVEGLTDSLEDGQIDVEKASNNLADSVMDEFDSLEVSKSINASVTSTKSAEDEENSVEYILRELIDSINTLDSNMGDRLREALDGTSISLNNREFGRLVKGVV